MKKPACFYDERSFRLNVLRTTRNNGQDTLQDLNYYYDAVGNITAQQDNAQQTFYFNNQVIAPTGSYTYDALYRLLMATGRELTNLSMPTDSDFVNNIPCPNTATNAMQNYTQNYSYDALGNILNVTSQGNWTRDYVYNANNNYLLKHDPQQTFDDYTYDTHGNMLTMPHLSNMSYDYQDQLISAGNGTFTSYYNYDAEGNRTRKVVVKGNIREERYYIGGYEVFRKYINDTLDYERKTINISDDEKVFLRIEQKTGENEVIRYQYDNHLGSACLELDELGAIISYEEYHPFGTTSYRSGRTETEVSLKRYKYCGKERDEETGLYYYGMRYYADWICRFVSVDPLQFKYPYYTPYQYAGNKPVSYIDLDGGEEKEPEEEEKGEIAFIDEYTGKYLGSYESETIEGFSIRSILSGDFRSLQKQGFKDVPYFSINKTKEVTVEYEQIINMMNKILTQDPEQVEDVEKGFYLVYDKSKNSIYAVAVPNGKSSEHIEFEFRDYYTHSTVIDDSNLVIMASIHTHPAASVIEFMEQFSKVIGKSTFRDAGVSPDDADTAQRTQASSYAIAKYETSNTPAESVFYVDMNGIGKDSKIPITQVDDINTYKFNIVKHAIKSRLYVWTW